MSGIDISRIGFGSWQLGGSNIVSGKNVGWNPVDETDSINLIRKAYLSRVRFFDTADVYGNGLSETLLGKALSELEDAVVCTKFGWKLQGNSLVQDFSPERVLPAIKHSLKRLQRNKVEHFLLHNPKPSDITSDLLSELARMKQLGLAGSIGISVPFIEPFLDHIAAFDTFELIHNPLTRQNEQYLPLKDKTVFIRSIFASGLLLMDKDQLQKGKSQFPDWRAGLPDNMFDMAISFIEQYPDKQYRYAQIIKSSLNLAVDKVIIGISKPKHLEWLTELHTS